MIDAFEAKAPAVGFAGTKEDMVANCLRSTGRDWQLFPESLRSFDGQEPEEAWERHADALEPYFRGF